MNALTTAELYELEICSRDEQAAIMDLNAATRYQFDADNSYAERKELDRLVANAQRRLNQATDARQARMAARQALIHRAAH